MRKTFVAAVAMTLAFAVPAFAAEGAGQQAQPAPPAQRPAAGQQQPQRPEPSFEDMRASILKGIERREAEVKAERDCVEAAKTKEDIKACFEASRARMEKARAEMGRPGGQGGPAGMRPGGQGQMPPPATQTPPQGK